MIMPFNGLINRVVISIMNRSITVFHASKVDFSEPNIDTCIVKNFNILSSLIISLYGIFALLRVVKTHRNARHFLLEMFIFFNLIVVGLCSVYFHSTLCSSEHLLDIYSITCLLSSAIWIINPKRTVNLIIGSLISVIICLIAPEFELLVLFAKGFYIRNRINKILAQYIDSLPDNKIIKHIKSNYKRAQCIFIVALVCWIINFFFCHYLNGIHLHFIFHGLIGHIAYQTIDTVNTLRNYDQDIV